MRSAPTASIKITIAALMLFSAMMACARTPGSATGGGSALAGEQVELLTEAGPGATRTPFLPATPDLSAPILTPTPDDPHPLPTLRSDAEQYVVENGDMLSAIAQRYGVSLNQIVEANQIPDPNHVEPGVVLTIPPPDPDSMGPGFKIVPDSELVNGPMSAAFDVGEFIRGWGGYLADYEEEVDGRTLSGVKIVARVSQEYSVNPRLLLAVLQYQSGWITQDEPAESTLEYPMGMLVTWRDGLYRQLAWAADNLNRGYYLWRVNGVSSWILADGSVAPLDPTINAGTAGVQHLFAQLYGRAGWEQAVSPEGVFATYSAFFGYPFHYAIEPLLPVGLEQPAMQLPFEPGREWSFTGGPHGGWGSGSAWAALDFAPPGEALGCVASRDWVTAVAEGLVVRTGDGVVIQDLDGDGYEQTGWTVLYMHVESNERVEPGTYLHPGDRVGHPSCEGGVSTGTHLHLARRYNGEWIPADQPGLPFVLDGWVSSGAGIEYDGFLKKGDQTVEAWEGRIPENAIQR